MARKLFFFGFGLAVALFAGWIAFPRALYVQKPQPLDFLHKTHAEKSGVADCAECHSRDIWGHSISRLRRAPHEGMKMSDCEDCHRRHKVEVGCLGCHE